jgi:hypothetical protein
MNREMRRGVDAHANLVAADLDDAERACKRP